MDHHIPRLELTVPRAHIPRVHEEAHPQLPDLLNEMWLQIFGWATSVPGILDPDFQDSFEMGLPVNQLYGSFRDEQHAICQSLATKSSLVLVCRRWRALATPLLYQAVLVADGNLDALHRSLKQAAQGAGEFLLGSLVRRLDIVYVEEDDLPMLGEVFGYLSHIRIIIAASRIRGFGMPESIFATLAASGSLTLQKLVADVKHPSWRRLLGRLPNLRTLLRVQRGFCPHDLPLLPNLRFTALDSWHAKCSPDRGRNAAIPFHNLEHVLLRWYEDSPQRREERRACISGFLSKRTPALTTVHLETLVNVSKPVFRALAENCPRLTHIVFYYLPHETWSERPAAYLEDEGWGVESTTDGGGFEYYSDGVGDDDDDDDDAYEHNYEHVHAHEHEHGHGHVHGHVHIHEYEHDDLGENEEIEDDLDMPPIVPKYKHGHFPLVTHLALFPRDGQAITPHSFSAMFIWLAEHRPPSLQVVRFLSRKVVEDLRWKFPRALARGLEMLPGVRVEDHEGNDMQAYVAGPAT